MTFSMKWLLISLILVFTGTSLVAVETPEELLTAVNKQMKKMDHPAFTLDSLTVWLASQADLSRHRDGKLPSKVEKFLRRLVAREKFDQPLGFWIVRNCRLNVATNEKAEWLPLPDHYTFELAIYNVPPGEKDRDGNVIKAVHDSIVIATALGAPE